MQITTADARIVFSTEGDGPDLVLLHPFPTNRDFWNEVAPRLAPFYRLVMPDLRGHGHSAAGNGPATMEKQADDLAAICDAAGVQRAIFAGVSIGGYILFEFWRRYSERAQAIILCDTKAVADTPEARSERLKMADKVEQGGTWAYIETMLTKLLGKSTHARRPELVEHARGMMSRLSPRAMAAILRGMAHRPDSVSTLAIINVPTLVMVGDEDALTPRADAELMHNHIRGSRLEVVPAAGHFSPFEQPEVWTNVVLPFLRGLPQDVKVEKYK